MMNREMNMMNREGWPWPNSLRGWVAALLVSILIIIFYYQFIFPPILTFYKEELYVPASMIPKEEPDNTLEWDNILSKIKVRIDYPRYVAPFGYRWIYVTVQNQGDSPIQGVKLWVEIPPADDGWPRKTDVWIFPYLFGGSSTLDRILSFEEIPPHSTVSGRIPFLASETTDTITGTLWISWTHPHPVDAITGTLWVSWTHLRPVSFSRELEFKLDMMRSLSHSFLEFALLPPWSNGFIIFAAFVICAIVDRNEPDKKKDIQEKDIQGAGRLCSTLIVPVRSLKYMLIGLMVLSVVEALLWYFWQMFPVLVIVMVVMVVMVVRCVREQILRILKQILRILQNQILRILQNGAWLKIKRCLALLVVPLVVLPVAIENKITINPIFLRIVLILVYYILLCKLVLYILKVECRIE